MDKDLIEAARRLHAESLFESVSRHYHEANRAYIQKQIAIAAEYFTEDQKTELRRRGYEVHEKEVSGERQANNSAVVLGSLR